MTEQLSDQDRLDGALDRALAKTLQGPSLPPGFRTRLLEAQYRQQLGDMRVEFVRLRWRTLATLLAVAFVAGAGVATAMPWLVETFGGYAMYVAPGILALVAVGLALNAAMRRRQITF
jgi:hypothetical protein